MNNEKKEVTSLKGIELLSTALQELGCTLEKEESEGHYSTMYQGEYFIMRADDDDWQAMAYDVRWLTVPLDDIDALADVRRAVNECNTNYLNATLCYTIDEEDQVMAVHTKFDILLIGTIPDYRAYLNSRFEAAFLQRREFHKEMAALRKKDTDKS